MEIEITKTQTVKVEEGDILLVTIPPSTNTNHVSSFRKSLTEQVRKMVGSDKVIFVVAAVDHADIRMELVKESKLDDIYQRLEALEKP